MCPKIGAVLTKAPRIVAEICVRGEVRLVRSMRGKRAAYTRGIDLEVPDIGLVERLRGVDALLTEDKGDVTAGRRERPEESQL